jgi:hypothetical protein
MTTPSKIKEYPLATLSYDSDSNILTYRVKQGITVDIPEIKEMLRYVEEFMGHKRHYAIIDFGANLMSTTEARKVYADSNYIQTNRIADAFLVQSTAVRLVANFFIIVTKPLVPTKLFTDENLAIAWLQKMPAGNNKSKMQSV